MFSKNCLDIEDYQLEVKGLLWDLKIILQINEKNVIGSFP